MLTLNVALYGFVSEAEYLRVQMYLRVHGGWQLEAVSTLSVLNFGGGNCPRGGHLPICIYIFFGHLDHCISLSFFLLSVG